LAVKLNAVALVVFKYSIFVPDWELLTVPFSSRVKEFCEEAFKVVGVNNWGDYIEEDPQFVRKNEVYNLVGDNTKIRSIGWEPKVDFKELVRMMVCD